MAIDCVTDHRVYVYDRGGVTRIGEITSLTRVQWGRIRDDISEAEVEISSENCIIQSDFLSQIEPGRHEFVIFRNGIRVWEGPITRIQLTGIGASFYARDIMHYAYRTVMHNAYNNSYPNITYVTTRAVNILTQELARKEALNPPINVLPYLVEHHNPTDARTSRNTQKWEYTVFEHIDDLAAKGGMDYTVLGRALHIWDTSVPLGYAPRMTEADFAGALNVTIYGMELATLGYVTDGQGNVGIAGALDPYYGEVEQLYTAYDEDTDDGPPPTQAALESQAQRNLTGRNPTPVILNIPAGSSLNPAGVMTIDDLVPGVFVPVTVTVLGRLVSQMQKIAKVTVTETAEGESITIDMGPATQPDDVEP